MPRIRLLPPLAALFMLMMLSIPAAGQGNGNGGNGNNGNGNGNGGSGNQPGDSGGVVIQCELGCLPTGPQPTILSETFPTTAGVDSSGESTVTVKNTGTTGGWFSFTCGSTSAQLLCDALSESAFWLNKGAQKVITVDWSTRGNGTFTLLFELFAEANSSIDSLDVDIAVSGPSFIVHAIPFPDGERTHEALVAHFTQSVTTSTVKLWLNGSLQSGASVTSSGYTKTPTGLGSGTFTWKTEACTASGRCDTHSTSFAQIGGTTWQLDDSLPPAQGHGIEGLLGGLPLPDVEFRGCPVDQGHPEIRLVAPTSFLSQPGSGGHPAGLVFAASVSMNGDLEISTLTVDRLASDPTTCEDYGYLDRSDFNWGFWTGTDSTDVLWDAWPDGVYGPLAIGRLREWIDELTFGRREVVRGTLEQVNDDPGVTGEAERLPQRPSATPPLMGAMIPDPGAINKNTFRLILNGDTIVKNGVSQDGDVTVQGLDRVGASVTVASSSSLLNAFVPGNHAANNGGWNTLVAGIADSTNHWTYVETRFVHLGAGNPAAIALAPLRRFWKQDMGECAAFGVFQCDGLFFTQTVPGFVTRDKSRDLHLVYRSASQWAPTLLPIQASISREQKAPDSIVVTPRVNGVSAGPSLRYAGVAGAVNGVGAANLWEHADEVRVFGAMLDAVTGTTAGSATIRNVAIAVNQYYPSLMRTDTVKQHVVETAIMDTSAGRFGAGWQLAELGRLVTGQFAGTDSAMVLLLGDGSYSVYRKVGSAWTPPPGETGRLVRLSSTEAGARWVLFVDGGASVGYRDDGWQVWSKDLLGNRTIYAYSGSSSRLASITDPTGRSFLFNYTGGGHVANIEVRSAPAASPVRIADLEYDGCSGPTNVICRLVRFILYTDAGTRDTTRYRYTVDAAQRALVDSVIEPRVFSGAHPGVRFVFDTMTKTPTEMILPANVASVKFRGSFRRSVPRQGYGRGSYPLERMLYPNQLRGTHVDQGGRATDYQVDRFGAPTWVREVADPAGAGGFYMPGSSADAIRRIDRDTLGRVTKIVRGNPVASSPDSMMYTYDALHRVTRLARTTLAWPIGAHALDSLEFTYDSVTLATNGAWCSRLKTSIDPYNVVTTTNYGTSGKGKCLPLTIVEPGGLTTTFTYGTLDSAIASAGRPTQVTDPSGLSTTVTYHSSTWNSEIVTTPGSAVTQAWFNAFGRTDSVQDPMGMRTRMLRDRIGRVLAAKSGTGAKAPTTRTWYARGGLVDSVHVYASQDGTLLTALDTAIQRTRNYYDLHGRLDSLIGPGSRSTTGVNRARKQSWRRDIYGNPTYAFVGNGSYVGVLYDRAGRVRHRYLSEVGGASSIDGERYVDPAGKAAVDSLYLGMGRVLSAGQRHTSYYDNKGRLETTSTDDTYLGGNVSMQWFGYTDAGALRGDTTVFSDGASVRRRYEYNRRGQRTLAADTLVATLGSVTGDKGGEIRYAYDSLTARLTSISSYALPSTGSLALVGTLTVAYDAGGRDTLRTMTLNGSANPVTRRTTYDAAGRVSGITVKSGSTVRYSMGSTTYSPLGELRSATEWRRNLTGSITFKYDSVYGTRRLLVSNSNVSLQSYVYAYDVFGNRLSETHVSSTGEDPCTSTVTYTYATDNRLLTRPTTTPTCAEFRRYVTDQAGMRLAELDSLSGYAGLQSAMTYTAAGQLYYAVTPRAAAGPYDHAWHWYDAGGRRMMSHVASGSTLGASVRPDSSWGTRTYYLNDGDDVGLTLVKGSGPTWRYHQRYLLTGLDEVAALRLSLNGTPTNLAVVSDRQGSFLMAVEASGAEKSEAGFYLTGPFGQLESGSAAATDGGTHAGLGFTGAGTATAAGGYVYLRNRWYDPQTGRFLSQDPIGLAGGVNLYAYAGNNPVSFSDPFGLDHTDCTIANRTKCTYATIKYVAGKVGVGAGITKGRARGSVSPFGEVHVSIDIGHNGLSKPKVERQAGFQAEAKVEFGPLAAEGQVDCGLQEAGLGCDWSAMGRLRKVAAGVSDDGPMVETPAPGGSVELRVRPMNILRGIFGHMFDAMRPGLDCIVGARNCRDAFR